MTGRSHPWRSVGDPLLLVGALLLTAFGIAMIYSAGLVDIPSSVTGIWRRQLTWAALALIAFYVTSRVPLRWLEWVTPWAYGASILLLAVTLVIGTGPNTRSWIDLGPLRMQPSEFAKLATILMLAREHGGGGDDVAGERAVGTRLLSLWRPLAIVFVPFALVMAQPDLGSAIIFGVILMASLFWAGVPLLTIFMLISPGLSLLLGFSAVVWGIWFLGLVGLLYFGRPYLLEGIAVLLGNIAAGALTMPLWGQLAPYQQNRLLVFLNPELDPRGAGWHLLQSRVAIGSGGWFGHGYGQGPQKRLAFLPEQHTDFIFSVVGEELGFVGVVVALLALGWFLTRVLRVARGAPNTFGSAITFCLFAVWFAHLTINIGMTVGLMPVTGLPLPFLSYGGSFLLMLFVGLGVVDRVAAER